MARTSTATASRTLCVLCPGAFPYATRGVLGRHQLILWAQSARRRDSPPRLPRLTKRKTQAADGTCCTMMYGNPLVDCGGATDLAGAAGCCPSDWLLRYHLGGNPVAEDTSSIDCVSFISQTDCAAHAGFSGMTANWIPSTCSHILPTPSPTTATPGPTPAGYLDRDEDGVQDAAADGTCCAFTYGNAFAGCSGATDLAGAASCCPSDFLHRYSIQPGGEVTDGYDCVSFISQSDCAAHAGWSGMTPMWLAQNCPHTMSSVVDAAAPRAVGLAAAFAALAFF